MSKLKIWLTPTRSIVRKVITDPKRVITSFEDLLLVEQRLEIRKIRVSRKLQKLNGSKGNTTEKLNYERELIRKAEDNLLLIDRKELKNKPI